jgi:2-polyprenyl-3-methyl-5-hydroxy-6-metoxy-1,4-benzoquinol methylase
MYAACEVCGSADPEYLLSSPRLDGPLVRCRRCGLHYVGARRSNFTFAGHDHARSAALADRVAELGIVRHDVEEAERPLRLAADRERLARVVTHVGHGRLLDVGSANGTFLTLSRERFDARGVEPEPGTSERARAAGLSVTTGTLEDVERPPGGFHAITMFHVIEHLDSPRAALGRVHDLLAPGGAVVIETPTVDNLWFRLAPARWRQLIPDHYFFFSRETLFDVLRRTGFEPLEHEKVGRRVSLRFVADRARRAGLPGSATLERALRQARLEDRTIRVNPGDIMSVVAVRTTDR